MPTTVSSAIRKWMLRRGHALRNYQISWHSYLRDLISILIWWLRLKSMISVSSHSNWIFSSTHSNTSIKLRVDPSLKSTPIPITSISSQVSWCTWDLQIVATTTRSSVSAMPPMIRSGTSSMIHRWRISSRRTSLWRVMGVTSTALRRWGRGSCSSRINRRTPTYCSTTEYRSTSASPPNPIVSRISTSRSSCKRFNWITRSSTYRGSSSIRSTLSSCTS